MRRSAWLLPLAALAVWVAAVAWPVAGTAGAILTMPQTSVEVRPTGELLLRSAAWSLLISGGAVLLGWAPGRVLGKALARGRGTGAAMLMLAPICLPAYVIFYAWWQSWPPGTLVHDWALAGGAHRVRLVKDLTLFLGLACWSWPLVAWCVAGSVSTTPAQREESLLVDGAGPAARAIDRLRCDGPGLALGGLIVFLMTFGNTTCFDLAEIFTYGNELRAIEALGATPRDTLQAGLGAAVSGLLGAIAVWAMMAPRLGRPALRTLPASRGAMATATLTWIAAVGVPVGLMTWGLAGRGAVARAREFASLYGPDLVASLGLAALSGVMAAIVAGGMLVLWQSESRFIRGAGNVMTLGWLLTALVPGTLVGAALEAAYNAGAFASAGAQSPGGAFVSGMSESNTPLLASVYHSPVIVILGHLARFAFVAALLGRWMAARETPALRDQRRLDGDGSLAGLWRTAGPRLRAAALGAGAIVMVLSLSEIAVTAQVHPPSTRAPISLAVLHAMHYQRPYTVMIASLALVALAVAAAATVMALGAAARRVAGGFSAAVIAGAALIGLPGCAPSGAPDTPLDATVMFGAAGQAMGQFNYPRAIAVDDAERCVYVVDKTARVQRFDFEGTPLGQWRLPEWEMGKPTGLNVGPNGHVYVADTHYFRVIEYDDQGQEVRRFGGYGQEPGQFIYPTDIEFGPAGELYVSEYGGNDRVQVFAPDGAVLFSFGSFGPDAGQFNRPQSMIFNADRTELFIADACNHRIVVVDPRGKVLRQFGRPGQEPGALSYPYDLMVLGDGSLLVCEFGNNRLQRFTPDGRSLGVYGRLGFGRGELQYPWGVDGTPDEIFVVDSGNNRVQMFRSPA